MTYISQLAIIKYGKQITPLPDPWSKVLSPDCITCRRDKTNKLPREHNRRVGLQCQMVCGERNKDPNYLLAYITQGRHCIAEP